MFRNSSFNTSIRLKSILKFAIKIQFLNLKQIIYIDKSIYAKNMFVRYANLQFSTRALTLVCRIIVLIITDSKPGMSFYGYRGEAFLLDLARTGIYMLFLLIYYTTYIYEF